MSVNESDRPAPPPLRAVITGASSGIGQATAIALARHAARRHRAQAGGPAAISGETDWSGAPEIDSGIIVHYCNHREGAERTVQAILDLGVGATAIQADLRSPDDRRHLVDSAWDFLQTPTTWVNNAGVDVLTGAAGKLGFADKLRLLMDVDVIGTIELARAAVRRWLPEEPAPSLSTVNPFPPSMTFIGWDQAPHGMEGDAGQMFGPVKAAVMAFSASLAQEVAPRIRVNTVAPGWIQTAWGQSTDQYWNRRASEQSLMGRWGTPEDVAAAICFVADPENTFCTGQTLCVNGGWNRTFRRDEPS